MPIFPDWIWTIKHHEVHYYFLDHYWLFPALVLIQKSLRFAEFDLGAHVFGALCGSNLFCSIASQQFNLIQLSLRWLVSLQYWNSRSGLKDPSAPGASWDGLYFTRYGLLTNLVPLEAVPPLLVNWEVILRPVVTGWLIASTSSLGSRKPFNWLFWFAGY